MRVIWSLREWSEAVRSRGRCRWDTNILGIDITSCVILGTNENLWHFVWFTVQECCLLLCNRPVLLLYFSEFFYCLLRSAHLFVVAAMSTSFFPSEPAVCCLLLLPCTNGQRLTVSFHLDLIPTCYPFICCLCCYPSMLLDLFNWCGYIWEVPIPLRLLV